MLERLRNQIGTAGLLVAIVALVAALGGGAYAATGGPGGGRATASAKQGKQGKQGKPGKTGPAGPAGPAGSAGPAGPAGPKGDTGAAGANGTNGTNGTDGEDGEAGSPWTAGGTLPPEATETGTWSLGALPGAAQPPLPQGVIVPISFPIPLANGLASGQVHYIDPAGEEVELFEDQNFELKIKTVSQPTPKPCPGTSAAPKALAGNLCIYQTALNGQVNLASQLIGDPANPNLPPLGGSSASKNGAILVGIFFAPGAEAASGWGTWAVTAPE